jgi:hypothetical protein
MKRYLSAVFVFGLMTILTVGVFYLSGKTNFNHQTSTNETVNNPAVKPAIAELAKLPLIFEKNQGQTDEQVKFMSRGAGCTLFLTESEAVLTLQNTVKKEQTGKQSAPQAEVSVLRMKTVGGNSPSKIEGQDEQIAKSNYFIGEDEQKWLRDVPNYGKIRYSEIYSGVDLVYYGKGRQLEYDFIVQPNADPKQIALEFEGAKNISLNDEGELVLELESGLIKQHKPIVYQETDGERREIAGNYILKDETQISFAIGEYDVSKPLVIDPVLSYATYLGSREYEFSNGIAVDAAGNAYITGYAVPPSFPTTPGSVQPTVNNPQNSQFPFVSKISADGSTLLYSTYLGGAGIGIAVDAAGNAFTLGTPNSGIFATTPGALDMGRGRVAVMKLNPQGNQIIYSARFGSSGNENPRDIAIDPAGNAYLTGTTNCGVSPTQCDFPILNAPQPNYVSGDIFVSELNAAGTALVYSTYVGGSSLDIAYAIDVDNSGSAFITCDTTSPNFPTTPGAFDRTWSCNPQFICRTDTFVTRIAPNGGTFVYSTYIGGLGTDKGNGIAVDESGNAYVAGFTQGRFSGAPADGYPTTPGAFKMFGSIEGFVTKVNPTGTALVYSSLLGGLDSDCFEERINDVDIDRFGNAYVVGLTSCGSFPTVDALQPEPSSFREEAFLTKFAPNGATLVYSTFLGGPRYDEAYNVAVQPNGAAYVTGTTSGDFQLITPGAFDTTWNGADAEHPDDIFVLKVDGAAQNRTTPYDFDGDGKADVSVYREGVWHLQQSANGYTSVQFGLAADKIAAADYDGDGKTDIAVFRDGTWYVMQSANSQVSVSQFGLTGDIPQTGDFDGDGKSDLAVFRPSNRTWYLQMSRNGFAATEFGFSDDKPVAGDYDGDGKADIAVFRASEGIWHLLRSRDGYTSVQFGIATDSPVPSDFDGDGKADVAVYREGVWYIWQSRDGVLISQFGLANDKPTPADYDGDGKADLAVYREGIWHLQRSTMGYMSQQFGLAGDKPIPNAFVP